MAGCKLEYNEYAGDHDCGYGSTLDCSDCKYGKGRKDPEAWANAQPEDQRDHANELRRNRRAQAREGCVR